MLSIMTSSSIMAISSTNMFMMWVSLELNLFSFVPLLSNSMSTKETESSINYFLSQSLGSSVLLMSSSMLLTSYLLMKYNIFLILLAIILKMGAAPCHYWYPMTMNMSSWTNCMLLSTWQKLAPLFILLYIIMPELKKTIIIMITSLNALIGGIMGLNQSSLKKIMSYSSITHMGWMLSGQITNTPCLSITYFMLYSMMALPLFMTFNNLKMKKIYELWNKQNIPLQMMLFISIMFLSLGGLPPLMGFFPKLLMMNMLLKSSIMTTLLLISGSIMNLFYYLNIFLNMVMVKSKKILVVHYNTMKMNSMFTFMLNFLSLSIIII